MVYAASRYSRRRAAWRFGWLLLGTALLAPGRVGADEPRRTENLIVITLDGFRWQELFGGADETLIEGRFGGVRDVELIKRRFWRSTAAERRAALMPFFWSTIAKEGQVFGDPTKNGAAKSTNGFKFSYPGYSEMFCGFADPRVDSNHKRTNPNLSVLEYLNGRAPYKGRVAAFCTWDVFPFIFRTGESGLKVHAGWTPIDDPPLTSGQRMINAMTARMPRYWKDNAFDVVTMEAAREHLLRHKPRVLYIGLGETDEWGHGRRYDLYLESAYNADQYIAELWKTVQGMAEYKDKTALVVTTDHGRGGTRADWTDHGKKVAGAEFVWIAVLGPDTRKLGVRADVSATQSQVAATIAQLLGEDFRAASPQAAPPLPDVCDLVRHRDTKPLNMR